MLETMRNGAIIFDRFNLPEQPGSESAEVVFCFLPGNAMTPFAVWHRNKRDGGCYWGHYHPGTDLEAALAYFKERRTYYRKLGEELAAERQQQAPADNDDDDMTAILASAVKGH